MCPQGPSAHPGPRAFWLGGVWSVGQLSEDGRGIGSVGDVVAVALRVLPGRGRGAGRGRRARRVHARRVHASEDRWWAAVEWDPPSWSYLPNIIRLIQDFRDRDSDSDGLRDSLTNRRSWDRLQVVFDHRLERSEDSQRAGTRAGTGAGAACGRGCGCDSDPGGPGPGTK